MRTNNPVPGICNIFKEFAFPAVKLQEEDRHVYAVFGLTGEVLELTY